MRQHAGAESTGLKAKTIHCLLEFDPKEDGFLSRANLNLDCDLLVPDKDSIVDVPLMSPVLKAHHHDELSSQINRSAIALQ